jgi:hypothetical protein
VLFVPAFSRPRPGEFLPAHRPRRLFPNKFNSIVTTHNEGAHAQHRDPRSQKLFSVHRIWFCLVLALLFFATNLLAQLSHGPHSSPNVDASPLLQRWRGLPAVQGVSHVPPGMARLQHSITTRTDFSSRDIQKSFIFQSIPIYTSGGFNASSTAIGDVNGDGIPDLAVANQCGFNCIGSVGILLGNGDSAFSPQ